MSIRIWLELAHPIHSYPAVQRVIRLCNGPSGYASGQRLGIRAEHIHSVHVHSLCAIKIIFNTGQINSEWVPVGVANNSQRGTSERVKEKILKISEKARAAVDNRADTQPEETSQSNKRALEERVGEIEAAVREERDRARDAENRAELAETAVMEERQRAQEAERRLVIVVMHKCTTLLFPILFIYFFNLDYRKLKKDRVIWRPH